MISMVVRPKRGFRLKTGTTSDIMPKAGRMRM